jgi:hypothetical protein
LSACKRDDRRAMPPLPDPTDLGLAPFPDCVVAVRVPAAGLTVYRLVRSVPATEDDFVPLFATGRIGSQPVLLNCGISSFLSVQSAVAVRKHPASRVAELRLRPDPLTHVARTNRLYSGDHVSVWAPKRRLLRAVIGYS